MLQVDIQAEAAALDTLAAVVGILAVADNLPGRLSTGPHSLDLQADWQLGSHLFAVCMEEVHLPFYATNENHANISSPTYIDTHIYAYTTSYLMLNMQRT